MAYKREVIIEDVFPARGESRFESIEEALHEAAPLLVRLIGLVEAEQPKPEQIEAA
jgi:hypothetical protein